jgi:hypothetical protein
MGDENKATPFDISFNEDKGYLHVTATGRVNASAMRAYDEAIETILADRGPMPILVDARKATALLTSTDLFDIAHRKEKGAISACRRAMVHQPGISGPGMYETIAQSLGQDLRTFTDLDEAMAWLIGQPEPDAGSA